MVRNRLLAVAAAAAFLAPIAAAAQTPGARPVTIPPAEIIPPQAPSEAAPLPLRALLPTSVRILRDSQGAGMVMYGRLNGKTTSPLAVLHGIFAYSQAFDPTPALPLVTADADRRHAEALFTATARGAPITGIAAVSLNDSGGTVSVFYDYADRFAASFPRMRQALQDSGGAASTVLSPLTLADGNRIGVPPGWRLISQGAGLVDLMGTQGEFVSLGAVNQVSGAGTASANALQGPCCDPVAALRAVYPQLNANAQHLGSPAQTLAEVVESQAVAAGTGAQAAFVLSKLGVGGRPYSYFALVRATAGFTDPWTLRLSGVTAPQPVFAAELPTLLQIWRSYSGRAAGFDEALAGALDHMVATQAIIQAAGPGYRGGFGANPAWDPFLAALPKGEPVQIDDARARKLVDTISRDTGDGWRIVPQAEQE